MERLGIFLIIAVLIVGMVGCSWWGTSSPSEKHIPIWDWYDLDAIRDNLGGNYILMTDLLNSKDTPGYDELASPTANGGKGWQPIGTEFDPFKGRFNGQEYEVRDLVINRPEQNHVGLFGYSRGTIENIGVVNVAVTGKEFVGGLVGRNDGIVSNSHSNGSVTGERVVGGLMGWNFNGWVIYLNSSGSVTGTENVGGLVGYNDKGTVTGSYSTDSVTGTENVGGLMGCNSGGGEVSDSHSSGRVKGNDYVGGLVGKNDLGTMSQSYSIGSVIGKRLVGGLVGWMASGGLLESYSTGNVTGEEKVGGLVGWMSGGHVSNSFWDIKASGQTTSASAGGTGKTTEEMMDFDTFDGVGWEIAKVDPGQYNPSYTWNIVNGQTYPFLRGQPIA